MRSRCNYARYARIPGYRPGKAPRPVIEKKFRKEIQDELTKKLVSKSYHEAIAEKQLRVVSLTNLEDVEFGDDRSMRFRATVVTAPEFELPEYKSIPVEVAVDGSEPKQMWMRRLERLARAISRFHRCAGSRAGDGRLRGDRFRRRDRRRADQRTRAGGEQEPARRKEILASSRAGEFSAAILRADRRDEAGRDPQRAGGISRRTFRCRSWRGRRRTTR